MRSLPDIEKLLTDLPDREAARRFYAELSGRYPDVIASIDAAVLSDLLAIASYSKLLSATLLHDPDYIRWLARERVEIKVRSKDELLESLSRFALLNSGIESNVMLSRFRRRELLRIYLRDIRRLATVTEITEELSNLADAIVEHALRQARQELENRFGVPLETDDRGRSQPAAFCIVALGKLGSKELNYSSDIDLLFMYSGEGQVSASKQPFTNREYFVKLAEYVIRLAGAQSGEGAAYRIDMRLRPRGTIGALALSLKETVDYYRTEARDWERQVLIRSRPVAGDLALFKTFFSNVKKVVFKSDATPARALNNVRSSKQRIDSRTRPEQGYNVKLGPGGIREIEFIAQALQLAHGGGDRWLRAPHTLVSLARLADRGLIAEDDLTKLFEAYDFLRRLEHRLQMEHGLQTHTVPARQTGRHVVALRMGCSSTEEFDHALKLHTDNVRKIFESVFGAAATVIDIREKDRTSRPAFDAMRSRRSADHNVLETMSPFFAQMFSAFPEIGDTICNGPCDILVSAVQSQPDFGKRLAALRKSWSKMLLEIAAAELRGHISARESKTLQTGLAEASINAALLVMQDEVERRYGIPQIDLSVLGLGKLGGRGVDYGSDLDLVLVYDDGRDPQLGGEIYSRAVEIFVTALSGMTRDGNLYRVDLRLRPYGSNGPSSNPRSVFVDYFRKTAAVWEFLAFVKLRAVTGEISGDVENEVRRIIHQRARSTAPTELRNETWRIRRLLEKGKGGRRRRIDIKYSAGGMLDVYFATRYLQLRDDVPDDPIDRTTLFVLDRLLGLGSISSENYLKLCEGYSFLSDLDHNIRLVTGRTRQLPRDPKSLKIVVNRSGFADAASLNEALAMHRLNIRQAYEDVLAPIPSSLT